MVILTFMAIEPLVVGHSIAKLFLLVSYFEPLADVHIGGGILPDIILDADATDIVCEQNFPCRAILLFMTILLVMWIKVAPHDNQIGTT